MTVTEPGSVLDGKYEILRTLGAGGMGEVVLARHLHLDEMRVIKVLRRDLAGDPDSQKRFLREARLATQVKHPNVAILYDCSRLDDGSFYMVWEHVEGQEVGDRLAEQGPFPVPAALELGIQALRGLAAIHAIGVIHRDVSPDNLMVYTDPGDRLRLKVIDLGLARTLSADPLYEVTQVGTFMGKLRYCSPEQARAAEGESLDHRSDLYSLGLVLYEMISGRFPFEGGSGAASLVQRLSQDPLPLVGRNPDVEVPELLDEVILRTLAREPDERYFDAVAMIEALDTVRAGLTEVSTREVPAVGPAPRRATAVPATAGGGATTAAGRPKTAELSPQERSALLQQIDRAAQRVRETTQVLRQAEAAIAGGEMEEAERLVAAVEEVNPGAPGLPALRQKLRDGTVLLEHRRRVEELEAMLARYLKAKQKRLAALALDSLLDLYPNHPRRDDYQSWVGLLDQDVAHDARVAEALAAGREAIVSGDFKRARRQVAALKRLDADGGVAEAFDRELVKAEGEDEREQELGRRRETFHRLVASGDVAGAERQLEDLAGRLPRVAVSALEGELEEARLRGAESRYEKRFAVRLAAADWLGARDVARELATDLPASQRPAEMLAEIDRHEGGARKTSSLRQGEKQIEKLIAEGAAEQARLALKLLLQLDPDHHRRRQFERQIDALGRG
ncbi:MAG TPA: protein kinase [Thermoanaerobaculia bacterium]|nr:protein kinase [Thermoanaerobaculia bacterium]